MGGVGREDHRAASLGGAASGRGGGDARLADASFACVEDRARWHERGERIACSDLERLRIPLAVSILLALLLAASGCGESDPDPDTVLDRALTRQNLSDFGVGPDGPVSGVVSVQALGYEDRVLNQRQVEAEPAVMSGIRDALGSGTGLRGLVDNLEYVGSTEVSGDETEHVSGDLDVSGLASALEDAGGGGVGALAGVEAGTDLEETLSSADFDLYAGTGDGVIRRLDLTLALDDPGNALPPTRIRFSLTPESPAPQVE